MRLFSANEDVIEHFVNDTLYFLTSHQIGRTGLDQILMSIPNHKNVHKLPGVFRSRSNLGSAKKHLVHRIEYAAEETSSADVYWAVKFDTKSDVKCLCDDCGEGPLKCIKSAKEVYQSAFHPNGGCTEIIQVNDPSFLSNAMKEQWSETAGVAGLDRPPGLDKCADIMFLGIMDSSRKDLWDQSIPKWGCALMATMGRNTETMFLTVIHNGKVIQHLWDSVHTAFAANPAQKRWERLDPIPAAAALAAE
jgi:hypothetical protein